MSVRIQLDNPHSFYTNLDFISGRVILNLTSDEAVSRIVVKVEGESKTRLSRPPEMLYTQGPNNPPALYSRRDRQEICQENHKILYKVAEVFPNKAIISSYTLRAGQHEYPFRIKLPINNGCHDPASQQMGPGSGFGGLGIQGIQQMQYTHVKRTLPPSLTGFPGEAEIRYYVKVTVQRPSMFKENRRSTIGFKFLPIEAPRPPKTTNEAFAKRPFMFQNGGPTYAKKGLFTKKPKQLSNTSPQGEVDARLPSPPILTCNKPLPMRILLRRTNTSPEHVFLMSLQVNLLGTTEVKAADVIRVETSTWVVMSLTGLSIPIGSPDDPIGTETAIDSKLWDAIPLPNTVAPSFVTCNLARRYELEVRIGLGYGYPGEIQSQTISIPLRFQIEIFSGIEPPAALLDAMTAHPPIPVRPPVNTAPPPFDPAFPPQVGAPGAPALDDAPPSYEDALAEDITQANGTSRPAYSGVTNENAPGIDEKGGLSSGHQKGEASRTG
ncbi:hypothetical protein BTUL_0006g01520 [Botrytis tulipae]|uniref:Arrestin-like N-terminal domain-containing protein n=1 Tax=Botrytis tulipae TaxID=87230 RepID=A0A4Z1F3U2_9HELO|nr:hypothetical protein BTUL_0006g01520 [Botrytis tulipae]